MPMVSLESRLRCKGEDVVAKVMDGEAVIINLATGTYYSMADVGAAIWSMIESGRRLDEIVAALAQRYDMELSTIQADVLRLADELLREQLVVITEEAEGDAAIEPHDTQKLPYSPPQLCLYRDMEDLLALDPPTPALADLPWKE
jgi:hypothetical protein